MRLELCTCHNLVVESKEIFIMLKLLEVAFL